MKLNNLTTDELLHVVDRSNSEVKELVQRLEVEIYAEFEIIDIYFDPNGLSGYLYMSDGTRRNFRFVEL